MLESVLKDYFELGGAPIDPDFCTSRWACQSTVELLVHLRSSGFKTIVDVETFQSGARVSRIRGDAIARLPGTGSAYAAGEQLQREFNRVKPCLIVHLIAEVDHRLRQEKS